MTSRLRPRRHLCTVHPFEHEGVAASGDVSRGGIDENVNSQTFAVGDSKRLHRGNDNTCNSDGTIYRCSKCNGVGQSIRQNIPCPSHPVFDGKKLYWVEAYTAIVRSEPDGTQAETFVPSTDYIANVVIDDEAVYWLDLGGTVWKQAK